MINKIKKLLRYKVNISVILASLLISGCGFALRGTTVPLPEKFSYTHITNHTTLNDNYNENNNIKYQLSKLIKVNGGDIVSKSNAKVMIILEPIKVHSRQIAFSRDANTREYENTYSVAITIIDKVTAAQLGNKVFSIVKHIQLKDNKVLAGNEQRLITKEEAEEELTQQILLYLRNF